MSGATSALFILDIKGRCLISRDYRGDVSVTQAEKFFSKLQEKEGDLESSGPVCYDNGVTYMFIQHNNVYLMTASRQNCNAASLLLFLHRIVEVLKHYFEELEEESLRDNFVVVYELLDEMMDFGYPQYTEANILSEFIKTDAYRMEVTQRPPMAVTNAVSWRSEGLSYKNNEVFLDVVESVHILVNSNGQIIRSEVVGALKMRTYLSGMPECKLGLNDRLLLEAQGRTSKGKAIDLDDIKFHQCVRLARFENGCTYLLTSITPSPYFIPAHLLPLDFQYKETEEISQLDPPHPFLAIAMAVPTFSLRSLLLLSAIASIFFISTSSPTPELQILTAERNIDLTSHIVRVYLTLKVENSGVAPVSEVLLAFSPTEARQLSLVKAAVPIGKKKKRAYQPLEVNPSDRPDEPNGTKYYIISLLKPLNKGETVTLETLYIMTHTLEPFPVEISQSESQLVYYRDSAIVLSPYPIKHQVTLLKTPSNKVESFTRMEPTTHAGTQLKYGPYEDRAPFSYTPIMVHFENNSPFAVVEELVREIEISHWGSIQITEHYKLLHGGARQKGGFSRVDYQNQPSFNGLSSFKHLHAELPPRVHSVYYRDDIGNISSSRLRISSKKSDFVVLPRYPLFGGWKSTFVIGYGVPLQDFLFESADGSRYLNYTFGCAFFDTVVDKLITKVVLPEGSTDASAVLSFSAEQRLEKKYSYLDVLGRTVLVLEKENVVPEHNIPFQVNYNFKQIYMLAEPLMLISVFLLFFVTCIAYLHIDFSISK